MLAVSGSEIMMCLCAKILNCNSTPGRASLNGVFSSRPGLDAKLVTDGIQMVSGDVGGWAARPAVLGVNGAARQTWLIIYLSR